MKDYLERVPYLAIPNFWTSEEYFLRAGWQVRKDGAWVWIVDSTERPMLPPVFLERAGSLPGLPPAESLPYWAGWPWPWDRRRDVLRPASPWEPAFLDFNYIYNPVAFSKMEGGSWGVYRKNVRKWPRDHPQWSYGAGRVPRETDLARLLEEWATVTDPGGGLYDPEVMVSFVMEGNHRAFLWEQDRLVGANVWDLNSVFVNFRYCVCDPEEPFLSEFLRWLFYQRIYDMFPLLGKKLVNDGGVLGRESLRRFKNKMNPAAVYEIYGWTKERRKTDGESQQEDSTGDPEEGGSRTEGEGD